MTTRPTPLFSIVIPTFNRSDLFPYAVQSILNQTFEDFEIILSDNCSSDNTPEIAKQFTDPRFKYIQTPRHFVIADAWEFARSHATGKLILMLSDDDALLPAALERFDHESKAHDADFMFCSRAEYRDVSYPGPEKNSVVSPSFSGESRLVPAEDFIKPLFSFRLKFDLHPSAFVFAKKIADSIAARTGRFFWTNGVEYSAWPMATLFAKNIVYIDAPFAVLGRTGKSWGSNIALCNPGKERIEEFIKDVDHKRKYAPLNNFTMCNLMAEGMLTAKNLFRDEFEPYEFDEPRYLRATMGQLRKRQALGVDVSSELEDLISYASKYPRLVDELLAPAKPVNKTTFTSHVRSTIGSLTGEVLRQRISAFRLAQQLQRGRSHLGFTALGKDFDFTNILECVKFLGRCIQASPQSNIDSHRVPSPLTAGSIVNASLPPR